jgi:ATP-dependent DNA ligase
MALYNKFRYIFPPRPKNAIPVDELDFWDNNTLLSQPKLNGSNSLIFTNGEKVIVMNRHNQTLTNVRVTTDEIKSIYKGNGEWMVLNAEYMNKSQNDETGRPFNHKFVIFDILVLEGNYLVGTTFEQRVAILNDLYGQVDCEKEHLYGISENIYRVKSYNGGFLDLYNDLIKIDMYEGLVMKRKNAKLELGTNEMNNVKSQLKCRKPTKNYAY